jgi:putative ABC transport system permease protein
MLGSIWRRLLTLLRRDRLARELDEELQGHHDALCQALEDEGHAPADAARLARLRLGGTAQIRESSEDEWRLAPLDGLGQDFRLAFRTLHRRPGFAAAAITTLALGIGASTAIFSVAYGVSLRPLAYPEPDRLIRIYEANPANGQLEQNVSEGAFHDWREGAASIESAALFTGSDTRFLTGPDQQPVTTMGVSPAFFDVLGARPMLGSGFKGEKRYTRGTTKEAVLSHAAWQRLFGGRPDVVGATLELAGVRGKDVFRVVGVMPAGFAFGQPVDAWRPAIVEVPVARIVRNWRYDRVIARLRPGATVDQARAELEAVAARLGRDFPAIHGGWTVTVESLHASVVGDFGRATWLLLAAVAVVLLVTCLNVGGLLVARAVARERETAVRAALGAGSWRLLRLWLAEASLLGTLGAGLGLLLAWSGVSALKAAAPPGIPRLEAVGLDLPTLAVAALSAVLAIAIFTMAPQGRASRRERASGLHAGSVGAGDGPKRQTTRIALTVAQCAGATTLVVLAVMLTRSFIKLTSFDLGWNPAGVLSLNVSPPMPPDLQRPWYRYVEWSDRLIARLEATPGIHRAAVTTQVPLSPQSFPSTLARGRGKTANDDTRWPAVQHIVTDGYFDLMGIRLVSGRTFRPADRFAEPQVNWTTKAERGAAVVSQTVARTLWPDRPAIGESLWLPDIDNVSWREVVGVVGDIQFHEVGEAPALHVFVPWTQHSTGRPRLVVKSSRQGLSTGSGQAGDAASIIAEVRDVVRTVEPGTTIDQVSTLDSLVSRATAQPRFTSRVVAGFGALALLLAAVGIYGTLSYLVGARTREIGIRLALGAPRSGIVSNVVWRGLIPAIAGGLVGLSIAIALARTFRALLFGVEPLDIESFAGGAALLLLVALAAALGPARRAARIDPAKALRMD